MIETCRLENVIFIQTFLINISSVRGSEFLGDKTEKQMAHKY